MNTIVIKSLKDRRISSNTKARDSLICGVLWLAAATSILVTIAIIFSVLFESIRFFRIIPLSDFLLLNNQIGRFYFPDTVKNICCNKVNDY